jgi:hypothetical protein
MAPRIKSNNKGGRPAKWNTDTAFALGLALQGRFTTPAQAARKAGIGKSTLFRWLRLGQAGDKRFAPPGGPDEGPPRELAVWVMTV